MQFLPFFRRTAALVLVAGMPGWAGAASFQIEGVQPVVAVRGVAPPALTASLKVTSPAAPLDWTASLEGNPAWASLDAATGSGAGTTVIRWNSASLAPGTYSSALSVNSGGTISRQPFTLTVIQPNVLKMEADLNRPVIYALHRDVLDNEPGYLIFLNTGTGSVEKVLPIGTNPTDLDISYAEGLVYVTNHGVSSGSIRAVDPVTREQVRALDAGPDVYKINAGRSGRLVVEGFDQWIATSLLDSSTGELLSEGFEREGDGEFEPRGRYYFRSDNNSSAAHLSRIDCGGDTFGDRISGIVRAYGTRNLLMSGDGSRLFWNTYVYDQELTELRSFGTELYACTFRGEVVFSSNRAINANTGAELAALPITSTVQAVSGDQTKLFQFDDTAGTFVITPMSTLAPVPPPVSAPLPASNSVILPPLEQLAWTAAPSALSYQVYAGTDQAAVQAAGPGSPLYLGQTDGLSLAPTFPIQPGQTYYWRVDPVGFFGPTPGPVWKFTVSPLIVTPNVLSMRLPRSGSTQSITLSTAASTPGTWTAAESLPWLTLSASTGTTGDSLTATFDPAGLSAGDYEGSVFMDFAGTRAVLPVSFTVFDLNLIKMTADPASPWIYALHTGPASDPRSFILFISTETRKITRIVPAGLGATDFALHPRDGRLYVSNWEGTAIQVIDPVTQTLLPPIPSGRDVYKLNAGPLGRLITEGQDQWVPLLMIDSATGGDITDFGNVVHAGDGECDPAGQYYYHCDAGVSSARLRKWDITSDSFVEVKSYVSSDYGSPNLVLSADGSRLFWQGDVYDADLHPLRPLGKEIYSATRHGEIAFSETTAINSASGASLATLPAATTVSAVSSDQSVFCYFGAAQKTIGFADMAAIAPTPVPGTAVQPPGGTVQLSPVPLLSWTPVPSALKYRVFFGTDAAAVAAATTASPEYLGDTVDGQWRLDPGLAPVAGTFYWRIDYAGLTSTTSGPVQSFQTLAATVDVNGLNQSSIVSASPFTVSRTVTGVPGTTWSASVTGAPWLTVTPSGTAGSSMDVQFTTGTLPPGGYSGSIVLTAAGNSVSIPVQLEVQAPAYAALLADPGRPRLYALQRPASLKGSLVVINTGTNTPERFIPLSDNPTGLDITADGEYLYAVTKGGRMMHRINLTDWTVSGKPLGASEDHPAATRYRVAAGAGGRVYWVDGGWAPRLHSLDFESGSESGPPLLADSSLGLGFGDIARNADGTALLTWTQYGWTAGSASSDTIQIDITGPSPVAGFRGITEVKGPLDTPVLPRRDGSAVFVKKFRLSPDLATIQSTYPAEIYAATSRRGIVFGATQAWRENSHSVVWEAPPGISATISAVAGDDSAYFYFDSVAKTLVRIPMDTWGDFPGPQPENGETVTGIPPQLTWTPDPAALRYEVYFGTDRDGVLNAAGPGSPYHLGTVTEPGMPLDVPFTPAGMWWWRVDTVTTEGTGKGPLWRFSGAPQFITVKRGIKVGFSSRPVPTLATEGTTIFAGYPAYGQYPGEVHIHRKRAGEEKWDLVQKITSPDGTSASFSFGSAIAIHQGVAWISAPWDGTGGQAYEFREDPLSRQWKPTGRVLHSVAPVPNETFGETLGFNGSVVAVGVPHTSYGPVSNAGAVDIFDASTLVRQVRLGESSPLTGAEFGKALSLDGNLLAVGIPQRQAPGFRAGVAEIWQHGSGSTWTRSATIPSPVSAGSPGFGSSLSLSGSRLAVGTFSDRSGTGAWLYESTPTGTWTLLDPLSATGAKSDGYVTRVALQDGMVAVAHDAGTYPDSPERVWLYRQTTPSAWDTIGPVVSGQVPDPMGYGSAIALTDRYLVTAYSLDADRFSGFTVHLWNAGGNLSPYITTVPGIFAEAGQLYEYRIMASDENPGDSLAFATESPLPDWLTLTPGTNGQATLAGIPPAGSEGQLEINLLVRDSAGAAAGQRITLDILAAGGIPRFLTSSGDTAADDGSMVVLSVTVNPGADVGYQWFRNGVPLSGQTSSELILPRAQAADAGSYQVRATRNGVWADSEPMVLAIHPVDNRFGGDWPTFGAGNSHAGGYPATLRIHKFLPAWNIPYEGLNQVVTGSGRVFSVQGSRFGETSKVTAHAIDTGVPLWSNPLPSSVSVNPPTYFNGRLYMHRGDGIANSPEYRCYDAATGTPVWVTEFSDQWGSTMAPVVDDTGFYATDGDKGSLVHYALDGTEIYTENPSGYDGWTPLLHEGRLYTWVAGKFSAHDPDSGLRLYSLTVPWWGVGYSMNTTPAAEGDLCVFCSGHGVAGIDLPTRKLLWRHEGVYNGSPALKDGIAYIISESGVQALNARSGALVRTYSTPPGEWGVHQPVILDDTLLVSTATTTLTFDLASGDQLQTLEGGGALTYSDGYLLAAGTDSTLRAWKVNQAAAFTLPAASMAAVEDVPMTWELRVTDPDGDPLSVTVTGLPAWLTAAPLTDGVIRFTGTPAHPESGEFSFVVEAGDNISPPASLVVSGSVLAVNDNPVATGARLERTEDAAPEDLPLTSLFSDEETPAAQLTYTLLSRTGDAVTATLDSPAGTSLHLSYLPDASGLTQIVVRATDPEGLYADSTILIGVAPVNDPPAGSLPDLTVLEDAPPVPVDLAAAFHDVDHPVESLRFSAVSGSPATAAASISGQRLSLTPQPDANGVVRITVRCEDPEGAFTDVPFLFTITPVNDPPVFPGQLPAVSAGGAAADAVLDFSPFVTDPDTGDTLTWRIIANTNPGIFSYLAFDSPGQLSLRYTPYVSGSAVVTIEVRDADGFTATQSFSVDLPALPDPALATSSALVMNRQTGLWEQTLVIRNTALRAIGGFEVAVTGLPAAACLYNASSCIPGRATAAWSQPLAAGAAATLVLEYYSPSRTPLQPVLSTSLLQPQADTLSSTPGQLTIDRVLMLEPGALLLEFPAIPGELYQVQYNTGTGWVDSLVRIRAAGTRVQWIDRGQPRTTSPPMPGTPRFYRVRHLAPPP